jgi:hypothetical protein
MGYGPVWIILSACVGATSAIVAQIVNDRLTRKRDLEHLRLQTFETFRRQFMDDKRLQGIDNKDEPLTDDEVDYYLGFFDVLALYWKRGFVEIALVDEVLGDSIIIAYDSDKIMKSIYEVRAGMKDKTYFEHFEELAKELKKMQRSRVES